MENLIRGPLAAILRKNRSRYNTLFAFAKCARPSLDGDAFALYLADMIPPVLERIHIQSAEAIEKTVDALYENILWLLQNALFGSSKKYPDFETNWKTLITGLAERLPERPDEYIRPFTRALIQLSSTTGVRSGEWVTLVTQCAKTNTTREELMLGGFIAAWRCGMAHYRKRALSYALTMNTDMQKILLHLETNVNAEQRQTVIARLSKHPWLTCEQAQNMIEIPLKLRIVAEAGRFSGYGGLFPQPPSVESAGDAWLVQSAGSCWLLNADVYGQVFRRVNREEVSVRSETTDYQYYPNGTTEFGRLQSVFSGLANARSTAVLGNTLAVTIPFSHHIFFIAPVPA